MFRAQTDLSLWWPENTEVRLFWLKQFKQESKAVDPLSQIEDFYCVGNYTKVYSSETGKPITTGTIIRSETDDPIARALPDLDLLEMRWVLQRVLALIGGPNYPSEDDSSNTPSWMFASAPSEIIWIPTTVPKTFTSSTKSIPG